MNEENISSYLRNRYPPTVLILGQSVRGHVRAHTHTHTSYAHIHTHAGIFSCFADAIILKIIYCLSCHLSSTDRPLAGPVYFAS